MQLFAGVELNIAPSDIAHVARDVRRHGAEIVVVHGECIVANVPRGTNAAAVRSEDVDILGHPGLLNDEDARAAVQHQVGGPSVRFLDRIRALLETYGLTATSCAGIAPPYLHLLRSHLPGGTLTPIGEAELSQLHAGTAVPLEGAYWFGIPYDLSNDLVARLQQRGAFVIAAINTFQYPAHAHQDIARDDIEWLTAAGVDAFQLDSIYEEYVLAARAARQ